jgi:3-oxoadipate enol-lactonase
MAAAAVNGITIGYDDSGERAGPERRSCGRAERPDYGELLAEVSVPTQVVVAADDEYTPVANASSCTSRSGARP